MTVRIRLSAKHLTIGDLVRAERGFSSKTEIVRFLAGFVVDENNNKVDPEAAMAQICELPLTDLRGIVNQFTEQIKAWQESAVPLAMPVN